jgi:hypothetical protein
MKLCSWYLTTQEFAMNAFYEHPQNSIRFGYRCLHRILLNGLIQPFQQPERVVGFFSVYRNQYPVSRDVLREIADQFHNWVKNRSEKWGAPVLDAPEGRRDEFVEPYFRHAKPDQLVVVLKAREPARILIALGNKKDNRWHLQLAQRWVIQYNFYVNDRHCGRMFVRVSPYFPFAARVCLNQHHWLWRAAYDLKKLRGKQIICRIAKTQRYEPIPHGLRTMAALVVLRDKVIKPLLAAARQDKPGRGAQNPTALDTHYHTARLSMQGIFHHLGLAA